MDRLSASRDTAADPSAASETPATSEVSVGPAATTSAPATLLLVAWILLGTALALSNGVYHLRALVMVVLATGAVAIAGLLLRRLAGRWDDRPGIALALGAAVVNGAIWEPGVFGSGSSLAWSRGIGALAGLVGLAAVSRRGTIRQAAMLAVVGLMAVAGVHMIRASPAPAIDVWVILEQAAEQLPDGVNVFTACWTGNPDFRTECVYPYLPFTTIVAIPFQMVLGDVRFAALAAMVGTAGLVHRLASPATAAAALAALVVLQPKLLFLIELAWTEPLLLFALSLMVTATVLGHRAWGVVGLAAALAMKQHVVLLVPLAMWWPAFGWRRTAAAIGGALLVVAPFALASPSAFFDDVVWFHLRLPARPDALSVFSWLLDRGADPSFLLVPVVTLVTIALALTLPRNATGFTVGSAGTLLVFNLVNKQSFFNHYSLVVGLLVLAAAVMVRADEPVATEVSPPAPAAPPGSSPTASPV